MLIGVVADSHGQLTYARAAVRLLESFELELVIHCGDIGSPAIIPLFQQWPTHFVFGNVDIPAAPLEQAIAAAGQFCHGRFGELELAGRKVAFLHGDDTSRLRETISSGSWDLVCHGHTHVASRQQRGSTLVLNPGALYRANPHSLAIVELPELAVTAITV